MHTSAFKLTQNTPGSFIVRVLLLSDGSELLSLIVHNHAAPQSNGGLIKASNRVLCQFLSCRCSLSLFQKKEEKEALLIFYNHTAEAKLQAIM